VSSHQSDDKSELGPQLESDPAGHLPHFELPGYFPEPDRARASLLRIAVAFQKNGDRPRAVADVCAIVSSARQSGSGQALAVGPVQKDTVDLLKRLRILKFRRRTRADKERRREAFAEARKQIRRIVNAEIHAQRQERNRIDVDAMLREANRLDPPPCSEPMPLETTFGEWAKLERKRQGWPKKVLADFARVSERTVYNVEHGCVKPETAQAILQALIEHAASGKPVDRAAIPALPGQGSQ
jgi:hypothetical protein